MKIVGLFKTKTHLPELIREVEAGEEVCITNRGREVAFIIPISKYYSNKFNNLFDEFQKLKKQAGLGSVEEIIERKEYKRK